MSAKPGDTRRMISRSGLTLLAFAVIGVGLVSVMHHLTAQRIVRNEQEFLMRSLNALVTTGSYDNVFIEDFVDVVDAPQLGTTDPVRVYRARSFDRPVALIMTPQAPDGYNGVIKLIMGIEWDGAITGVRVVSHRETPGLGDGIDVQKSDWILQFNRLSLAITDQAEWAVRRDGGRFDQFTSATITPRAVINAVHNALLFFEANRDRLFYAPSGTVIDGSVPTQ